jgi:hypothetical protein
MEFLEDLIEKDPNEAFPGADAPLDKRVFVTNDAVVNKWERELAAGGDPDLLEGFAPEDRAALERLMARKRVAEPGASTEEVPTEEEFDDDYTKDG